MTLIEYMKDRDKIALRPYSEKLYKDAETLTPVEQDFVIKLCTEFGLYTEDDIRFMIDRHINLGQIYEMMCRGTGWFNVLKRIFKEEL